MIYLSHQYKIPHKIVKDTKFHIKIKELPDVRARNVMIKKTIVRNFPISKSETFRIRGILECTIVSKVHMFLYRRRRYTRISSEEKKKYL